jgi:hypothetical protein
MVPIVNKKCGQVPCELLEGGVDQVCAGEWASRMLCWTLQAVTKIPAAEHILCGMPAGFCVDGVNAGDRSRILVYKRSDPGIAVFAIVVGGDDSGCVVSI